MATCVDDLIICGNPAFPQKLYFNPWDPFHDGAVECGEGDAGRVLRVFWGRDCGVWNPQNPLKCFWNATLQAFQGIGCATDESQMCMCRHLTDFVAVRKPSIHVASFSQLTALTADDIFVKLKYLTTAVAILFGVMHVGAFLGHLRTNARKMKVLRKIMCGPTPPAAAVPWLRSPPPFPSS